MFQFESLIDPTNFGTVRRYLTCSRSPITDVLFVRDEHSLATVAELLTAEHPTDPQRAQFTRWIKDGRLKVGVHHAWLSGEPGCDGRVDVDAIADEARCRVLFLPPYYLVQLRTPLSPPVPAGAGFRSLLHASRLFRTPAYVSAFGETPSTNTTRNPT